MLEGLFSPLHLLILVLVALIVFGIPLLIIFLLARWLDKRLQNRTGARVSIIGVAIGGITDVISSSLLAIPVVIYVMVKYDLLHASNGPDEVTSSIHSSGLLYGLQLAIGLGCTVLGGYVAAWIAKHDELLNGPRKSNRPRASDRTMVDTIQPQGFADFQKPLGVVAIKEDAAAEMEQHQPKPKGRTPHERLQW